MAKQRIEPRFDDRPADESDRFVVEPRSRATRHPESAPARSEPASPRFLRRLAWMIVVPGLLFLSWKGISLYSERSESPVLVSLIERVEQDFAAARERMHRLPIRQLARRPGSAQGRELRQQCEELGTAFVADPQPATRELMLQSCQAYEHYRLTGEIPHGLPDQAW